MRPAFGVLQSEFVRDISMPKIVDDIVERALTHMTADERRDLILSVVERMLAQMTGTERQSLMEHVVDSFLNGLPAAERQATVRELVPRLLAQLMQSGDMTVDELLWSAMGSLGALEQDAAGEADVRPPR
jgi:hypothetical protein